MRLSRRTWIAGLLGVTAGTLGPAVPARAVQREVEDLGLALELPDHWVPIPRAEILEARERAIAAGASTEWTMRAAWQPPPHLRWFTLPHLALESRPAPGAADGPVTLEHVTGRAGRLVVHTHRAAWRQDGRDLRLVLLDLEDRRADFEAWVASLRRVRAVPDGPPAPR